MTKDSEIGISRQGLAQGDLRRMITQAGGGHLLLDDDQLARSLAAVRPPDADCWVFAYGSLMWNPLFHPVERLPGRLPGYHRRFCFWIHAGRATPQQPGMMMALMPGGSCRGVLLRIAPDQADAELKLLWQREMVVGTYVPRLLPVRTPEGTVQAITFVANPRHPFFVANLSVECVAKAIAQAVGPLGRNRDYLHRTVETLREMGIPDQGLERLDQAVRSPLAQTDAHDYGARVIGE
ncbi:MAG TPA: gamma-glutamylcyclotransferase [Magnetospirillum sp.]|nr:gamma-glutamylcyclotransferase [Magnetospirillum sp.]